MTLFQKHRYSTEIFYNKSLSLILKANCSSFHALMADVSISATKH